MGSDMVVALPPATADGVSLFGQNCTRPAANGVGLACEPARSHALGEAVRLSNVTLPQARQTFAVLGVQTSGSWGFLGGVNERHVALGQTTVRTRLPATRPGLMGGELARLALERSGSARQAVDCLTDLVTRHGQGDGGDDHAFLVADGREAYVVETAGEHWAVQEVGAVRAVSEVCLLRQDWDRISRGLADVAIGKGWWPSDGSKLDFAGVVAPDADRGPALRRWGHATLLLEQYSGRLDADSLRRILCDHSDSADAAPLSAFSMERSLCRYPVEADGPATAASLVAELRGPEAPPLAWCAFGPPGLSVYFPVFLDGDLPPAFRVAPSESGCAAWQRLMRLAADRGDAAQQTAAREALAALQARFDHNAKEALAEAAELKRLADVVGLRLLLGSFMQANVERFEEFWSVEVETRAARPRRSVAALAEVTEDSWGA
jgi:secernin